MFTSRVALLFWGGDADHPKQLLNNMGGVSTNEWGSSFGTTWWKGVHMPLSALHIDFAF